MAKLPRRLTAHRFLIRRARSRAESAYTDGARKAYDAGWAILERALKRVPAHVIAKAAGDPADPEVLAQVRAAMEAQLGIGAENAAEHFIAGENAWFGGQGIEWTALEVHELKSAYQKSFADIGGFKGISETATEPIQGILTSYYADPQLSLSDLTAQLQTYFSPYKANQVGVTETTRMAAVNADLVAARVGAERWEWDSAEDSHVCDECDALDGQVFDMDSDQESPPIHVGDRCDKAILIEDTAAEDTP